MKTAFISIIMLLSMSLFCNKTYSQTIGEEFAGLFDCESYDLDKTKCPDCGYCFTGNNGNCPVCEDKDDKDEDSSKFTKCTCCKESYLKTSNHHCRLECPRCGLCCDLSSFNEHTRNCDIIIIHPIK